MSTPVTTIETALVNAIDRLGLAAHELPARTIDLRQRVAECENALRLLRENFAAPARPK